MCARGCPVGPQLEGAVRDAGQLGRQRLQPCCAVGPASTKKQSLTLLPARITQ